MQDIATELGVSKMTVSKCFNNSEDISEETKQLILKNQRRWDTNIREK